jgi:hypothetical protein
MAYAPGVQYSKPRPRDQGAAGRRLTPSLIITRGGFPIGISFINSSSLKEIMISHLVRGNLMEYYVTELPQRLQNSYT